MKLLIGKKTYIVAVLMLTYAVLGVVLQQHDADAALRMILEALGLGALRSGVATDTR